MNYVLRNFCELFVGAVCVADVQYKGRGLKSQLVVDIDRLLCFVIGIQFILCFFFPGRSKNVWESPKGCLSFSFTLQMEDGRVVPLIQYVVSLAVTEAIKDICDKNVSAFFLLSLM